MTLFAALIGALCLGMQLDAIAHHLHHPQPETNLTLDILGCFLNLGIIIISSAQLLSQIRALRGATEN